MDRIDSIYIEILRRGLPMLQNALAQKNYEWLRAEIEFLHNIPSLINETNGLRHEYFWDKERTAYLEAIADLDADTQYLTKTIYSSELDKLGNALREKGYIKSSL